MPRKAYIMHSNRNDYAWEMRGRTVVFHHVPWPKQVKRIKPLLHKGRKP